MLSHLLRIFFVGVLHIHTLHLTTFFKNKKRGKYKNVKKRKKRDLNKKNVKNVYYIYATGCWSNCIYIICLLASYLQDLLVFLTARFLLDYVKQTKLATCQLLERMLFSSYRVLP